MNTELGFNSYTLMLLANGLMLADGIWHFTSDAAEGMEHWPDWVIARQFGYQGMPSWFHRVIGVFLITGSVFLAFHIHYRTDSSNCYAVVFKQAVIPITTAIILAAVFISSKYQLKEFIESLVTGALKQVLIPTIVLYLISSNLW